MDRLSTADLCEIAETKPDQKWLAGIISVQANPRSWDMRLGLPRSTLR